MLAGILSSPNQLAIRFYVGQIMADVHFSVLEIEDGFTVLCFQKPPEQSSTRLQCLLGVLHEWKNRYPARVISDVQIIKDKDSRGRAALPRSAGDLSHDPPRRASARNTSVPATSARPECFTLGAEISTTIRTCTSSCRAAARRKMLRAPTLHGQETRISNCVSNFRSGE